MKGATRQNSRFLGIFLLLALANVYSVFQRSALGVISSDLAVEFSMTPSQLGTLASCFLYSYACMQIVSGALVSRITPRKLIGWSLGVSAVVTALFAMVKTVGQMMILRGLVGIGCSFIYVPAIQVIGQTVPSKWRATVMGFFMSAGHLGSLLAASPLKHLSDLFGWRTVFLGVAAAVLLLGIAVWSFVPKGVDNTPETKNELAKTSQLKSLLLPGVFAMIMWSWMAGGPRQSFQSMWAVQFYEKGLLYAPAVAGGLLTVLSVGCALGGPIVGLLSRRIGILRTEIIITAILGVIWIVLVPLGHLLPAGMQMVLLLCMGIAGTGGFTCAFAVAKQLNIPNAVGLYTGVVNCINFLGSAVISQWIGLSLNGVPEEVKTAVFQKWFLVFGILCFGSALWIYLSNRRILGKND